MENQINAQSDFAVKRKGTMLEDLAELIFATAGFEVKRNSFIMGFEIDLLVTFGDRTFVVECKQYEKSYLPVTSLILQWKARNVYIQADSVLLIIYGVDIDEDDLSLANDNNIIIWGMSEINHFLMHLTDRNTLCKEILSVLDVQERDIVESNQAILKKLIWEHVLSGKSEYDLELIYGTFRSILRHRIVTRLKELGSTPQVRRRHLEFFEHTIKETQTKKTLLLFKYTQKLNEQDIWNDIKRQLTDTRPFDDVTNARYLEYMKRLEEGLNEYGRWFATKSNQQHERLIIQRLLSLSKDEYAELYIPQKTQIIKARINEIILDPTAYDDSRNLEWILTDQYVIASSLYDEKGNFCGYQLRWFPSNLEETVEYICRLLYEYYGAVQEDQLIDNTLRS